MGELCRYSKRATLGLAANAARLVALQKILTTLAPQFLYISPDLVGFDADKSIYSRCGN